MKRSSIASFLVMSAMAVASVGLGGCGAEAGPDPQPEPQPVVTADPGPGQAVTTQSVPTPGGMGSDKSACKSCPIQKNE